MKDSMTPTEIAHFESLLSLFSVVMVINREMRVVFASDTLLRHLPQLSGRPSLSEVFELQRPRGIRDYQSALARLDSLYLMTSVDKQFAVRGQMLHGTEDGRDYLVFCGAPWLNWMATKRPDVTLGIRDFSHQDVQLDQLMYMATERNMVADLERLNAELRQAKEAVEHAQAARNALFAQMSHELRTPLNGVVSALALMDREALQGRSAHLLDLARKSTSNMLQVINYVLDITKLESAQVSSEITEFKLRDLVETVIDIVRARALEKQLDLRLNCSGAFADYCRGDAAGIRQVLLNLLINAIKFTDRGEVRVNVRDAQEPGMTVRIEVIDSGVGIAKERQAHVFTPFASSGGAVQALNDSTGLGLDIAKRSIEAMGGRIGVVSEVGVGSLFWVELPLQAVEEPCAEAARDEARSDPAAEFAGRVLLVDDNETNLALMQMILESVGVTVVTAGTGADAVRRAEAGGLDLVLMDISMPDMDGFEATRQIRRFAAAEALPVLALTAYTGDDVREQAAAAGMNGYLAKPLEMTPLSEALTTYLGGPGTRAAVGEPVHVDIATVQTLQSQIGLENLRVVIDKFVDEAQRRWDALNSAESSADLAREAHTLASTCRSFGLPGAADLLKDIEAHAKAGGQLAGVVDIDHTAGQLQVGITELKAVIAGL